jgi:long-subunit acyl-CoA synthetase (AMP-forming)
MDDDGHLLGAGERGEIVIRGSLVMAGYQVVR